MRSAICFAAAWALASSCAVSTDEENAVVSTEQALDVTKTSSLTIKQGALLSIHDENARQNDTVQYYNTVRIGWDGTGQTIKDGLPTLDAFINNYFSFVGTPLTQRTVYYYNRADLGIGREMHCVDRLMLDGQIACYVRNFAAGDDNSEFTFGLSSNIAFKNMAANHPFATVAMVYRDQVYVNNPSAANGVFFAVYNAANQLLNLAALDRTGIQFAAGKNTTSVPGVNFNNHIPSNCVTCHGGKSYDTSAKSQTGSLFLPFDLDQFEYENAPGRTRAEQLDEFKHLNEMVWKVAARSGSFTNLYLREELNDWYNNSMTLQGDNRMEVFEHDFIPGAYPQPGWTNFGDVFTSVVRPACQNCHAVNETPFDTEPAFHNKVALAVPYLCNYTMPHAVQVIREFWLSGKPRVLESYLRAKGDVGLADQLAACGPGNVATLDPPLIGAALSAAL